MSLFFNSDSYMKVLIYIFFYFCRKSRRIFRKTSKSPRSSQTKLCESAYIIQSGAYASRRRKLGLIQQERRRNPHTEFRWATGTFFFLFSLVFKCLWGFLGHNYFFSVNNLYLSFKVLKAYSSQGLCIWQDEELHLSFVKFWLSKYHGLSCHF